MKKQKKISVLVACAAVAAAGYSFMANGGIASAAGHEYIYFKTRSEGVQDVTICKFYDSSTASNYDDCDVSYGSYDSTSKTLTLGSGINNLPNGRVEISTNGVVVTANANIESAINAALMGITLDFGSYSFTDVPYKITDSSTISESDFGNDLVIESGAFNIPRISVSGPLEISGGIININSNPVIAVSMKESFKMSGGTINISECGMAIDSKDYASDFEMTGGTINVADIATSGVNGMDNIIISDGTLNLKSASAPAGFGFSLKKGKDLTIDGGEITIDGFKWGISGNNSKIYFNGGTTIIKNSVMHTIWIVPAVDPENDIVFSNGMGIKEDTYVFYDDNSTGIAEPGNVTIAEGYSYRKHYGWETIDGDTDNDESDVRVPDTGAFGGESGGVVAIMASLGAVVALAAGLYAVKYAVKRRQINIGFQKKQY